MRTTGKEKRGGLAWPRLVLPLPRTPPTTNSYSLARFVPGKRKMIKRSHKKSHGLMSFSDIARHTAESWRTVDDETSAFVTEVARLIMARFKEIEAALGGALSKSQISKAERAQCYASFWSKVVHDPSSEPKADQRPAQELLQQTKPLQQGLVVVGVNPPGRSLPTMSANSIQSSAFGGDRTIGTGHSTIAAVHHWMPQMGPMQRGNAGSNQLSGGVPSIGVNSNQALAYVDRNIGTGQDTAAPRHHFVRASAAPPFARYPRPLLEADRSFFSGPLSPAPTGLGGTGPFGSADPSSKMSMLSRLASHRLAKPSVRLDSTTVCAVQPEGNCNPLDDLRFSKLERLEAAWAANKSVSYTNHVDRA